MRLVSTGTVELAVVEQGVGRPLVLIHGFPLDHTMWRGQIDALSRICRVIAPDLRGFGRSPAAGDTVQMPQFADDVASLMDALDVREPIVFCGLSMGGYIGWQFQKRHRARLAALIACDTRAVADPPDVAQGRFATADRVLAAGAGVLADAMLGRLFAPDTHQHQPELVTATREVILKTSPLGAAAALRGMAQRPDFSGELGGSDVPTLVICGEHDVISPVAEMREFAAQIPLARFIEVRGAGHMSPLEQPSLVNAAIAELLGQLPRG